MSKQNNASHRPNGCEQSSTELKFEFGHLVQTSSCTAGQCWTSLSRHRVPLMTAAMCLPHGVEPHQCAISVSIVDMLERKVFGRSSKLLALCILRQMVAALLNSSVLHLMRCETWWSPQPCCATQIALDTTVGIAPQSAVLRLGWV